MDGLNHLAYISYISGSASIAPPVEADNVEDQHSVMKTQTEIKACWNTLSQIVLRHDGQVRLQYLARSHIRRSRPKRSNEDCGRIAERGSGAQDESPVTAIPSVLVPRSQCNLLQQK